MANIVNDRLLEREKMRRNYSAQELVRYQIMFKE